MALGIKEETKELESLLKISKPIEQAIVPDVDNVPEELQEPELLFTIDYEKEKKKLMKRARNTIVKLVKLVIPNDMFHDEFIQDKINQDADQLSSLYWQKQCIEIMQKTLMETVAHGNASPRYFETFVQISKNHSDIADQISKFETFIRKNYTDIKYDIKDKEDEAELASNQPKLITANTEPSNNGILITSTKDFIKNAKKDKLKILQSKHSENPEVTNLEDI